MMFFIATIWLILSLISLAAFAAAVGEVIIHFKIMRFQKNILVAS